MANGAAQLACPPAGDEAARREPQAVRRAREYLCANIDQRVLLSDLSAVAEMSRFQLMRAFRRVHGLPPHRYLTALRIARAKELIAAGLPLAGVAVESGFCDQSHLTRLFKQYVGVTPQAYAAACVGLAR